MTRAPTLACRMILLGRSSTGFRRVLQARRSFVTHPAYGIFRVVLRHLREHCPTAKPVVVRAGCLEDGTVGECARRSRRFVIRLNEHLDEDAAVEVLLHEWAHALAWNYTLDRMAQSPDLEPAEFDRTSHDEAWGCAYSRVWRAYLDVISEADA